MLAEKLTAKGGHRDDLDAVLEMPPDETALIGLFPNRKTGAGCAPCIQYV
jgi:hypothetical protein